MKPLLRLLGVSKIYRMGEVEVPALRQASLDVLEGEFLVILGQSGSGKSTLLNLLGGMDRPSSGQVLFGEQDLARANDRALTLYRRYQIGFVFQFFNLVPTLTALENVEVVVEIARQPMPAREALRLVGLEQRGQHFPSQLSGGQQQRVAIARALAGNPRLLLCDEPTGNLDSETSRQILELLQDVNQRLGKTVVMITHSLESARIGHRVAELKDGTITGVRAQEPVAAAGLAL
ncbi:MAG: ABC transporter ATP-binding protein [Candidatus Eremiobacteraeota bacterium]|nr:ABC transporter ATP-binding protein [Candidatus Eremiobacteraeota bacterium]MCW5869859.1 ABC transporter ATP-binding protein [Candidatus Eremiobacteraeota bacterium]